MHRAFCAGHLARRGMTAQELEGDALQGRDERDEIEYGNGSSALTDWDWIMGVNVWGPLRLTRALLPAMIARDRGKIAFVALVGFAEALRLELADTGSG